MVLDKLVDVSSWKVVQYGINSTSPVLIVESDCNPRRGFSSSSFSSGAFLKFQNPDFFIHSS